MLFIDNKYTRWYYQIISSAKSKTRTGYTEKHHIIPKSLGGNDCPNNLVTLTAREHYVCHLLLTKMVIDAKHRQKMFHALWAMTTLEHPARQQRHVQNSKSYAFARKLWSKHMSANNPMYSAEIQQRRVRTWKENRSKRGYIPPRTLKDKFITPHGVFKTKKSIQENLDIPEHTLNVIYSNLDSLPTNNGRRSKRIDHLNIDFTKSWRDNGFGYV